MSGASGFLHRRTFTHHQLETEVEHRHFGTAALDGIDHHGDGVPTHFIAVGADAGQRRDGGGHEFEVVEADEHNIPWNRNPAALAFEQHAKREIVIDAEHGVD